MRKASIAGAGFANSGGAKTCTKNPKSCTASDLQVAISRLIKFKFPAGTKAFSFLMEAFGLKERAAKHRLANSVSYTIEELQTLIQGEDGYDYLKALMAESQPQWWTWAQWAIEQGALKRLAVEATQQSLQLEAHLPAGSPARRKGNSDVKKLGAELSRAQTALGLLDSFSGRAVDRAMVQAQAARRR